MNSTLRESPAAQAALTEKLGASGLRATRQRELIYGILHASTDHPTADEVFARAKREIPSISLATVYSCLETLARCDLVKPVNFERDEFAESPEADNDFEPEEVKKGISVSLAMAPVEWNGVKINVLDAPGYADFVGDLRAGLRAADAALFVVSAVDGVDGTTRLLWEECAAVGMPRALSAAAR